MSIGKVSGRVQRENISVTENDGGRDWKQMLWCVLGTWMRSFLLLQCFSGKEEKGNGYRRKSSWQALCHS